MLLLRKNDDEMLVASGKRRRRRRRRTAPRIEPVKISVGMSVRASVNAVQSVALSALSQLRDGSVDNVVGHHCCCRCCCLSSVARSCESEPHGGHRIMVTTRARVGGVCRSRCPIWIGLELVATGDTGGEM